MISLVLNHYQERAILIDSVLSVTVFPSTVVGAVPRELSVGSKASPFIFVQNSL